MRVSVTRSPASPRSAMSVSRPATPPPTIRTRSGEAGSSEERGNGRLLGWGTVIAVYAFARASSLRRRTAGRIHGAIGWFHSRAEPAIAAVSVRGLHRQEVVFGGVWSG